jgi:hypothetical protein
LLASLGLAEEAKRASSLSEGLVAETTPGKVEAVVRSAAAAHQQVVRKLAARPALDDANKAMCAAGALALAQAAMGYSAMTENFGATKKAPERCRRIRPHRPFRGKDNARDHRATPAGVKGSGGICEGE